MMVKESAKNCATIIQSFSLANKPAAVPELVGLNPLGGGVLPYISHIGTFYPKGVFGLFWSENGLKVILPILVWNQVWFLRKLQECMNVFIISIPNEILKKRNM